MELPRSGLPLLLLVDDDLDGREGLAEYFGYLGFEVAQAANGLEAVDRATRHRPDAVILDMALPGMDGCEVLACLRADDRLRRTPVIILSACAFPRDRQRALDAGCDLFFTKPCSPDEIYAAVVRLLEARFGTILD